VTPVAKVPAPPDLPELHHRSYDVRSYAAGPDRVLIRGRIVDTKPPGVYFEDDPDPLEIHHMVIDLTISFPELEIVEADVVMETHPHGHCADITGHYANLVGLSIARGFTHKVRELFGGPRGCTHTTALLQAMAPIAVQSIWSMRHVSDTEQFVAPPTGRNPTPEEMRARLAYNINSCHVWADPGPMFEVIDAGEELPPPLWAHERAERLGQSIEDWRARMRG
jgi:hypothetical protein